MTRNIRLFPTCAVVDFGGMGGEHGLETAHELRGFVIPRPQLGSAEI